MVDYAMTIDGARATSVSTFAVLNPATGQSFAAAPECSPRQLDQAFESAARAFVGWRADEATRRDALRRAAEVLDAHSDELVALLSKEQGKPQRGSVFGDAETELAICSMYFRYYADLKIPTEVLQDDAAARVEVRRSPLGVVAGITPWNFPAYLSMWKVAPALLAGNTMVLKPSEFTPLTVLRIGELLADVLPPGVLNIVSGAGPIGARMSAHPLVDKISFTGSTATGKLVASAAAPDLKRLTLELGGNDPAVVLDDADVARIAPKLFEGAFANCGQVCTNIKRVYVPLHLYADMVDALAEQARAVRMGDGSDEGVQLGPLNNRPQIDRVAMLVDDAVSDGARVVSGGRARDGGGYFYEPTIVADVSDGTRIVDEEQFGPALPVVPYSDVDDAIRRANASHFGLTGSVWSSDPERAAEVGLRLECGTVWTNTHNAFGPDQPFAGRRWSGIGVENGTWGLLGYTQMQVLHQNRQPR